MEENNPEKVRPSHLDEPPLVSRRSRSQEALRQIRKNRMAFIGLVIFLLFFLAASLGVLLTSGTKPFFDPAAVRLSEKLKPPLARPDPVTLKPEEFPRFGIYLLGTDELGRDVFSRMLQGAWVSLTVGFVSVGISIILGIVMGGISGYFGQVPVRAAHVLIAVLLPLGLFSAARGQVTAGAALLALSGALLFLWSSSKRPKVIPPAILEKVLFRGIFSVDTLIMRFVDIMLCFPSFFLILTVVALLPPSMYNIMIVIGLTSWEGSARFVRAEFLSLREQDFVTAAKALGVGEWRIIFRHMIPNAIAPVLVSATIGIATAILTEAGLSFLGFGVPPPHATWGNILSDGKRFIFDAPWLTFTPGFAILLVVLSFNLFGEGLRDILNPRLQERH